MRTRWLQTAAVVGALGIVFGCGDSDGGSGVTPEAKGNAGAEKPEVPALVPPAPHVAKQPSPMDLPAVPEMPVVSPAPSGAHRPRELRLLGGKYLDVEVSVEGYVVWIYDCAASLDPDLAPAEARKVIAEQPERCLRPHLLLGDAADTPPDDAILVVELAGRPIHTGDHVRVRGVWAKKSPKGFARETGLLVYQDLESL